MNFCEIIERYKENSRNLGKMGFTEIGDGAFSEVFVKDDVILKFFFEDDAYLEWLKFCFEHQDNKYIPKLMSKVYDLGDEKYAVFMETLQLNSSKALDCDVWKCRYLAANVEDDSLSVVVDKLKANSHMDDMHSENIMFRGEQPVVTDPWAYNSDSCDFPKDLMITV